MKFESKRLRRDILKMAYEGQSVHVGCAFSLVEIFAVLYRNFLNSGTGRVDDPDRNLITLSKGHGVMAQYACLHELGWIDDHSINHYFQNGSRLKGLAEADIPGVEISSGSLGHGLSVAAGLALSMKLKKSQQKVFCIIGDGESNEGSIWEALLFSAHFKLSNLLVIVDYNKFQAMGKIEDIMNMEPFLDKFKAFGCDTVDVNGHDESALQSAIASLLTLDNGKPKAVLAHTVKGKGVSFMEHDNIWHYSRLNTALYQQAMQELTQ